MKSRDVWLVTLLLLLAAGFRLVALQDLPPGLAQDEVLNADIAGGILAGRHSLFFREGWGHEPLYHYLGALFQLALGDNYLSIRLPSVFCGLLLLALTFAWVKGLFGQRVALGTAAGMALSWWPIIFSRVGIRPVLEPLLLILALITFQRGLQAIRRANWWMALAGAILGLTFYTYTAARVLPLIFVAGIGQMALFQRDKLRGRWHALALFALVALLVLAPLLITLGQHPDLDERVDQLSGPIDALRRGEIAPLLQSILRTLGVFAFTGDPRWTYSLPGRPLFDPLGAVLFLTGILIAFRNWRRPKLFFSLLCLGVGLLPSMVTPQSPSIIRIIGALPVVYLFPALVLWDEKPLAGTPTLSKGAVSSRLARAALWGFGLWLLIGAAWTIRDGFILWPAAPETHDKYQTVLLDIARHIGDEPGGSIVVTDSWYDPIDGDSLRRNLGYDPGARWVQGGKALVFPGGGASYLYVPEYAPPAAELLAVANLAAEPLFRSEGSPSFAVYSLPNSPTVPPVRPAVTFGKLITLLGYDFLPSSTPGAVRLLTHWQVEDALPGDLSIFLHLLAADGTIVSQHDGLDAAAATLKPGDEFVQLHRLPLPGVTPAGAHTLQIGLYRRDAGSASRLLHDGDPADRVLLYTDLGFDGN